MKIFISHSSRNKDYGNALVELLRGIGIQEDEMIFTSNTAYGIPIGQNIFTWLRSQIADKPFVIYLLSKEYYSSIACLNEMGAAWVIENAHAMLFTPEFDLTSSEFREGAIDPREIGFYINNEERLLSFMQLLNRYFRISTNPIIINQKLKKYLLEIEAILGKKANINRADENVSIKELHQTDLKIVSKPSVTETTTLTTTQIQHVRKDNSPYSIFIEDVMTGKLKAEELLLIYYMTDTGRSKIMTGWQEHIEVGNIKDWEEIKGLDTTLSNNYNSAVRKLGLRNYTETSALTSSGNPKEVKLKQFIEINLLNLPQEVLDILTSLPSKFPTPPRKETWNGDDLPF